MILRQLFASLLVALSLAGAPASAGQFIDISGGTSEKPVRLVGYLAQPPGTGPFPAVVLLHGCGGFHAAMVSWADRLSRWGYVALALDSFGPRGIDQNCTAFQTYQGPDSYAALRLLATRPFVRAGHVAVMGFSQGAAAVLAALETGPMAERRPLSFRAGIAFYPGCNYASGLTTAPVLILIGDADTWTPASSCQAMIEGRSELGAPRQPGPRPSIELVIYPGAHHGFDLVDLSLAPGRGVDSG